METLGIYLKIQREHKNLSLKDVENGTGITDTRLSRIEKDQINQPSPLLLESLAEFFDLSAIDLYLKAGYLRNCRTLKSERTFYNIDQLSENEFKHIQEQIDYLIMHKRTNRKEVQHEV